MADRPKDKSPTVDKMVDASSHPGLDRILADPGAATAVPVLGDELSGADVTTLLLEVARRRAGRLRAADVLRQYERDRFVAPGQVAAVALARLEADALATAEPSFEAVTLAPTAPFGTHAVLAGVNQNNVVTTTRMSEVAADPTNSLALEAAVRRRGLLRAEARSQRVVSLAGLMRVTRAQVFDGPRSFAHFGLIGFVSAGRDLGHHLFEAQSLPLHLQTQAAIVRQAHPGRISIGITDFSGTHRDVIDATVTALDSADLTCAPAPERTQGKDYYAGICFKLMVEHDDGPIEIGDGGFVDWTQALLQNRKERLLISGLGLERLAMVL